MCENPGGHGSRLPPDADAHGKRISCKARASNIDDAQPDCREVAKSWQRLSRVDTVKEASSKKKEKQ